MKTINKTILILILPLALGIPGSLNASTLRTNDPLSIHGSNSLTGTLFYASSVPVGMKNSIIYLYDLDGNLVTQTNTDINGAYSFPGIPDGTYTIVPTTNLPWGGVNATDALLMELYFARVISLSGLRLEAADDFKSGYVNAMDALAAVRRYVGIDQVFSTRPDFYFENPKIVMTGGNSYTISIYGICYGDVDASYNVVAVAKSKPQVYLENTEVVNATEGDIIDIPVVMKDNASIGAISLSLGYPSESLEILGVTTPANKGTLLCNNQNGNIRISWFSSDPMSVENGQTILNIKARVISSSTIQFGQSGEGEFADAEGKVIPQASIAIPVIKSKYGSLLQAMSASTFAIIPNPVETDTRISYTSATDQLATIHVINMLGQIVYNQSFQLTTGENNTTISMENQPKGLYFVELWVGSQKLESKKLIKN